MISSRWILISILWLSSVAIANESPLIKTLPVTNPSNLLLVGNSYLYFNNSIHDHLRGMLIAGGLYEYENINFRSVTISNGRLNYHDVANYLRPGQLGIDEPFEVVILQGHSTAALSKENRTLFENSVKQFSSLIRNQGGGVALYMTPSYVSPHKLQRNDMMRDIESLYLRVGNEIGALVIPVGLAFEESYRRRPDLNLHAASDGSHPSLFGTYLGAATVFASLYDQNLIGNSYDYFGAIDADIRLYLQQVAADTVNKFYQLSD